MTISGDFLAAFRIQNGSKNGPKIEVKIDQKNDDISGARCTEIWSQNGSQNGPKIPSKIDQNPLLPRASPGGRPKSRNRTKTLGKP